MSTAFDLHQRIRAFLEPLHKETDHLGGPPDASVNIFIDRNGGATSYCSSGMLLNHNGSSVFTHSIFFHLINQISEASTGKWVHFQTQVPPVGLVRLKLVPVHQNFKIFEKCASLRDRWEQNESASSWRQRVAPGRVWHRRRNFLPRSVRSHQSTPGLAQSLIFLRFASIDSASDFLRSKLKGFQWNFNWFNCNWIKLF